MELLQAVNTVLPFLGTHVITRIEGAKHPTVDLVLAAIDRHRQSLITEGWWFNELTLELSVGTDGMISVPKDTLSVYGLDCNVEVSGDYMFNLDTGSRYFDKPIKVKLVRDLSFEELPLYAALYVTYAAGSEVYLMDYGRENSVPELQLIATKNEVKLRQEELRKRKHNSHRSSGNSLWRVRFR